jgi:hypothetical protein
MNIKLMVAVAAGILLPGQVGAEQRGRAETLFACTLSGGKTVRVTRQSDRLTYRYGTDRRPELTIVGSPAARNLFAATALHGGPTYYTQLRFVRGTYSYIVYAMEGGRITDSAGRSGLMVFRNGRRIMERSCARMTSLSFDVIREVPEDTEGAPLAWGDD